MSMDQIDDQTNDQQPQAENVREILNGPTRKLIKLGPPQMEREYVQEQLSFISLMDWFALVGQLIDSAMTGENKMSVAGLFEVPQGRDGQIKPEDFKDADTFVHAVGKIVRFMPDFWQQSFCIWLNVPDYEREMTIELMKKSPALGGISRTQFKEIIKTFLQQNFEDVQGFFRDDLGELREVFEEMGAAQNK